LVDDLPVGDGRLFADEFVPTAIFHEGHYLNGHDLIGRRHELL
jgi:hypothetical protein